MEKPALTVAAVIEKQQRFLLVEENIQGKTVLNQPAGHVENGETVLHAISREVWEETAWHFTPQQLLGVYQYTANHITYIRFCFSGLHYGYEASQPLDKDILRTVWLSREEIAAHKTQLRSPLVTRCIDDFLGGNRYPLHLLKGFVI